MRIDLRATLDGARLALQVDIGFGDAVTPEAQAITYPTLLGAVPAATLRAYPKLPGTQPIGMSDAFAEDAAKQVQWQAFLNQNRLRATDLGEVVRYVRDRARQLGFAST